MDGYSRLVAVLKVALPLAALALLSTLFLLSRSVDPTRSLPFGDGELPERLRGGQVITSPFFAGQTEAGENILFSADLIRPDPTGDLTRAEGMHGQIRLLSGNAVTLSSDRGTFSSDRDRAVLEGDVDLSTSTGFTLRSQELHAGLTELSVESPGAVSGLSPMGRLDAGAMTLTRDAGTGQAHLLFKDGVKLLYDPGTTER
jgi:lipopolysaccharide export system protein LptC